MVVRYNPIAQPEYPSVNLMGAFAQGQAMAQNALQQQALQKKLDEQEALRGIITQPGFDLNSPEAIKQLTGVGALDEAMKLKGSQDESRVRQAMEQNYLNEVLIRGKRFNEELPGIRAIAKKNVAEASSAELKNMTEATNVVQNILSRAAPDGSDWPQIAPLIRKLDPTIMVPDEFNPKWNERMMQTAKIFQDTAAEVAKKKALPEYEEVKQGDTVTGYRPKYGAGRILSPEEYSAGGDDGYMGYMASREGTAKNPRSSAQGPGQFIDSTFVDTYRKVFPDRAQSMSRDQILAQRGTKVDGVPVEQPMLEAFTAGNRQRLQDAGFAPTKGNTYLSHFLGADGAIDVLSASPDTPVSEILSPKAIKANPEVFAKAKTAGDLIKWAGGGPLEPRSMKTPGTPARAAQDAALNILGDIGFGDEGGDRVSKLISASTSGPVEVGFSQIPRTFGRTTPGRKAIADLEVLASEYTLEKLNNKLGAGFSNEDREFVAKAMGNIANPMIPAEERLSAWQEVQRRLAKHANIEMPKPLQAAASKPRGVAGEATEKPAERKRIKFMELGD